MPKFNATAIQQHQAARLLTQHYRTTRENILGDGLKLCRRAKAHNTQNPDTAYIAVKQTPDGLTAHMQDVAHCGNAHLCAFCSGLKASNMRNWIDHAFLPEVKARGLVCGLMTLTAHHKRESDWAEFVKNFYRAAEAFGKTMRREFKAMGSLGRVRGMECPVGSNGLHLHLHDLFTYKPGADIDVLTAIALAKWKAALRKFGLHCSKRGVDIKKHGEFDPRYIAKELAAHDTKTDSKSDLVPLFKLLDKSARGDKQAGQDWIRAAKAIQGRDRWNVGKLAKNLKIASPSDWKRSDIFSIQDSTPVQVIEYPQSHHMVATSPNSERAGLAFVLRAGRNEAARPGSVQRMALRMCEETIKADIELIKKKSAYRLAEAIKAAPEATVVLTARHFARYTFAIAEYRAKTHSYMFPLPVPASPPMSTPAPIIAPIAPGLELDFA
ncbi:hypothetical protein J8G26_11165 [Acidovorax sp. JG5]|uniref:hypothetical protein n=1 Tax=Acidovorax sp. JG5 TaxID=2822718 RepID=UPI001B31F9F8|nr:hypothetical protein [Acidovorax sp. JG5]MBP3981287.1 hypothetical protein [Acidovorax sp. JG5]